MESNIVAFVAVALVATFSPGPAVLLAISNGANFGLKLAMVGILGNLVAMIFYATLASLGLGVLLENGGKLLLSVIQVSGGIYLSYLGYLTINNLNRSKKSIIKRIIL